MKDIKDYLHLYLRVDCKIEGELAHKLSGISYDGTQNCWWAYFEGTEFSYALVKNVKPILRPLSDMTEEEKKELWRLVFSQGHGKNFNEQFKQFTGRIRVIDEKSYYNVPREVMMQGVERLGIESDGTIWADCDLHTWRHNQHEVTRWLLSKGFDLFGLIEEGIAIKKGDELKQL